MITLEMTPQAAAASIGPDMLCETACRHWIVRATRGTDPACPFCGDRFDGNRVARLLAGKKVVCGCGRKSSPRSGTILEGSTLSDRQIMLIMVMLHWEMSPYQISALAGCDHQTVYNWRNRLKGLS